MRLIDADALLKRLSKLWGIPDDWDGDIEPLCEDAFTLIEEAPTIELADIRNNIIDEASEKLIQLLEELDCEAFRRDVFDIAKQMKGDVE
jgi:hypothetical protein